MKAYDNEALGNSPKLTREECQAAILKHIDGLRGIDTHCHHLPDRQFKDVDLKFIYDHNYCDWMEPYPADKKDVPQYLLRNCSNSYF